MATLGALLVPLISGGGAAAGAGAATTGVLGTALTAGQFAGMLAMDALTVGGSIIQTKQQNKALEQQAKVADIEAKQREQEGHEKIKRTRAEGRSLMATQKALQSGSGVVSSVGTPLTVRADTAALTELQALDELYKTRTQATSLRHKAATARASKGSPLLNAGLKAGGSLLSSYGKYAT